MGAKALREHKWHWRKTPSLPLDARTWRRQDMDEIEVVCSLRRCCRAEFQTLLSFLLPGSSRWQKVATDNVDLLKWPDEYAIGALK